MREHFAAKLEEGKEVAAKSEPVKAQYP